MAGWSPHMQAFHAFRVACLVLCCTGNPAPPTYYYSPRSYTYPPPPHPASLTARSTNNISDEEKKIHRRALKQIKKDFHLDGDHEDKEEDE
jgi:hypothetical protein